VGTPLQGYDFGKADGWVSIWKDNMPRTNCLLQESLHNNRIVPWDFEPSGFGRATCPTAPMGVYQSSDRLGKDTEPYQRFMGSVALPAQILCWF
jgi:hypothetical protein